MDAGTSPLSIQMTEESVAWIKFRDRFLLDHGEIGRIEAELLNLLESRQVKKLILDFSNIQALSSRMLGCLVRLQTHHQTQRRATSLHLCNLHRSIRDVFSVAKLTELFSIHEDCRGAIESVNQES